LRRWNAQISSRSSGYSYPLCAESIGLRGSAGGKKSVSEEMTVNNKKLTEIHLGVKDKLVLCHI
jgi:hypothetical protein